MSYYSMETNELRWLKQSRVSKLHVKRGLSNTEMSMWIIDYSVPLHTFQQ